MLAFTLAGILLWVAPLQGSHVALDQKSPAVSGKGWQSAHKPIEADASENVAAPVRAVNLATQFGHHNYPPAAFIERRQGRVEVVAEIGTDGKATSCVVTSTSGHADLDLATCEGVYRATFTPATGQSGAAVPGSFSTAVTWNLLP